MSRLTAVSTRAGISPTQRRLDVFNPESRLAVSGSTAGGGVPGRVAQYLWDITDVHGNSSLLTKDSDADAVKDYRSSIYERYASVIRYFYGAQPNEATFNYMFLNRINPKLPADQRDEHCVVIRYNTLATSAMCAP